MFPSIIIIARANGRTADGADIFPRLIHPTGARWTAGGVSCGLSVSDGFPNRRAHAELPSGRRMDNGDRRNASRCAFGRRGKPIWCGPSVGKTAAIYLGRLRLSNSNPITSSVTRLSDRWH